MLQQVADDLSGAREDLLVGVALDELVEDRVVAEEGVELLALLLVLVGAERTDQLEEVLQGDHLLLQVQLHELQAQELLYVVDDDVLAAQRVQPLAQALDEEGNGV